jgi:hypothetical protein
MMVVSAMMESAMLSVALGLRCLRSYLPIIMGNGMGARFAGDPFGI